MATVLSSEQPGDQAGLAVRTRGKHDAFIAPVHAGDMTLFRAPTPERAFVRCRTSRENPRRWRNQIADGLVPVLSREWRCSPYVERRPALRLLRPVPDLTLVTAFGLRLTEPAVDWSALATQRP